MYQSVLAKRQGAGTSGTGFYFAVVDIKEVHHDKDLCLAQDLNTSDQYDLSMSKRGETAWPKVGDRWVIDRSMGHWMLQCKITPSKAPEMTGSYSTMDPDLFRLVSLLDGLGLVTDATTAGTLPAVTGSKNVITPTVQSILSILDARGILDDQTTAETVPIGVWQPVTLLNSFTGYMSGPDDVTVRYMRNRDNTITVEGRATPPVAAPANGVLMFTMATGFRPSITKYQTTNVANGVCGTITYGKNGDVQLFDFGATTPTRVLFHARFEAA